MTRYFRVPPLVAPDGVVIGPPGHVGRNHDYTPDGNGVIAVTDHDDADAFERSYPEVFPAGDLPAPPATQERVVADTAGMSTGVEVQQ